MPEQWGNKEASGCDDTTCVRWNHEPKLLVLFCRVSKPLAKCLNQGTAPCQSKRCACLGAGVRVGCWCEIKHACHGLRCHLCFIQVILSCIGVYNFTSAANRLQSQKGRNCRGTSRKIHKKIDPNHDHDGKRKQAWEEAKGMLKEILWPFQITIHQDFALMWPCALAQAGNHWLRVAWCLLAFQKCSLCCSCRQVSQTCDATQSFSGVHSDWIRWSPLDFRGPPRWHGRFGRDEMSRCPTPFGCHQSVSKHLRTTTSDLSCSRSLFCFQLHVLPSILASVAGASRQFRKRL